VLVAPWRLGRSQRGPVGARRRVGSACARPGAASRSPFRNDHLAAREWRDPQFASGGWAAHPLARALKGYGWGRLFSPDERPRTLALAAGNGGRCVDRSCPSRPLRRCGSHYRCRRAACVPPSRAPPSERLPEWRRAERGPTASSALRRRLTGLPLRGACRRSPRPPRASGASPARRSRRACSRLAAATGRALRLLASRLAGRPRQVAERRRHRPSRWARPASPRRGRFAARAAARRSLQTRRRPSGPDRSTCTRRRGASPVSVTNQEAHQNAATLCSTWATIAPVLTLDGLAPCPARRRTFGPSRTQSPRRATRARTPGTSSSATGR
jgi:hypothetical protein